MPENTPHTQLNIEDRIVTVFPAYHAGSPVIYLNTYNGGEERICGLLDETDCPDFTLAAIHHLNWNTDMVPWDCPPVFKGEPPYVGGADAYLDLLTEKIMPEVEKQIPGVPSWRGIAGYSLAGLFAVYAVTRVDCFSRVAAMSASLWFPNFEDYIRRHDLKKKPDFMYFSLGSREKHTGNPVFQTVQDHTENLCEYFSEQGIHTHFQLNPGNHFKNIDGRQAAGLLWLLTQKK